MKYLWVGLALVFLGIRATVVPSLDLNDTFKDLSHLYVGGLFGASMTYFSMRNYFSNPGWFQRFVKKSALYFAILAGIMTGFEIGVAVLGKHTQMSLVQWVTR